jgi:hypothetical protein
MLSICEKARADCIRCIKLPDQTSTLAESTEHAETEYSEGYDARSSQNGFVHCLESVGYHGIGGKVWDSSFVLMKYLFQNRRLIHNRNILELGSGTGVLGMAADRSFLLQLYYFFFCV